MRAAARCAAAICRKRRSKQKEKTKRIHAARFVAECGFQPFFRHFSHAQPFASTKHAWHVLARARGTGFRHAFRVCRNMQADSRTPMETP